MSLLQKYHLYPVHCIQHFTFFNWIEHSVHIIGGYLNLVFYFTIFPVPIILCLCPTLVSIGTSYVTGTILNNENSITYN